MSRGQVDTPSLPSLFTVTNGIILNFYITKEKGALKTSINILNNNRAIWRVFKIKKRKKGGKNEIAWQNT